MKIGDLLTLTPQSLAFGGDAVARHEGLVLFIPGALPGEKVEVRVVDTKKKFARAALVRVLEPSPKRIPSPCQYVPECGGCQYMHLEYAAQLDTKRGQVLDALTRIGKLSPPPIGVVGCPDPFYYRNRIKLHVTGQGKAVSLGFRSADAGRIVPIEHCKIAQKPINDALPEVRQKLSVIAAAKTASLRVDPQGKIDFWTENLPMAREMTMQETVLGKTFQTPGDAFFQVNPSMTEKLVEAVGKNLPEKGRVLIDAYCGVGLFSVLFAERFTKVVGIEQDRESVRWARKNMRSNGISHGVFHEGPVERHLGKVLKGLKAAEAVVLLDPPRDGCQADVPALLAKHNPAQIVYVSCNPPTLARDLARLGPGYKLESVQVLDMFPHTMHTEVVASLLITHRGQTPMCD